MDRKKIIAGISLLTLTGAIIYFWRRRQRIHAVDQLKAEQVAEEGYETAHDVLFPNRGRRIKRYRYPRH